MEVLFALYPCRHLVLLVLNFSHSSGEKVVCRVVLMCMSLTTTDIEHLFMYSLAVSSSSFANCQFKFFCPFYLLVGLSCRESFLYILDIRLWSDTRLEIFSLNLRLVFFFFIFEMDFFRRAEQKFLILMKSDLWFYCFKVNLSYVFF